MRSMERYGDRMKKGTAKAIPLFAALPSVVLGERDRIITASSIDRARLKAFEDGLFNTDGAPRIKRGLKLRMALAVVEKRERIIIGQVATIRTAPTLKIIRVSSLEPDNDGEVSAALIKFVGKEISEGVLNLESFYSVPQEVVSYLSMFCLNTPYSVSHVVRASSDIWLSGVVIQLCRSCVPI